jgi:alkylation response protein AidB-like acyl-CoA dehydrogenase
LINRKTEGANAMASRIERLYRTASIITFGGGTNEIQRDIISAAGLWMPRATR